MVIMKFVELLREGNNAAGGAAALGSKVECCRDLGKKRGALVVLQSCALPIAQ